jgi:PIN domain nuclease of toxin-antitoxin system
MRVLLDTNAFLWFVLDEPQLTTLDMHHKDPFDRLLIPQSLVEQIAIISSDSAFDPYLF